MVTTNLYLTYCCFIIVNLIVLLIVPPVNYSLYLHLMYYVKRVIFPLIKWTLNIQHKQVTHILRQLFRFSLFAPPGCLLICLLANGDYGELGRRDFQAARKQLEDSFPQQRRAFLRRALQYREDFYVVAEFIFLGLLDVRWVQVSEFIWHYRGVYFHLGGGRGI